jgi:hypothetical protein
VDAERLSQVSNEACGVQVRQGCASAVIEWHDTADHDVGSFTQVPQMLGKENCSLENYRGSERGGGETNGWYESAKE